jgi:Icc-related predicted phosphoesterase
MRVVVISDTHNQHRKLLLPEGDMIIHCGDVCGRGTSTEVYDFIKWFSSLPFKYKIFIAGNHDFYFEKKGISELQEELDENNIIYLNDSSIEVEGIKFWGSPVQPWFYNWAFNRQRGEDIKKHWDLIPDDIDILITHGPPKGILDITQNGDNVGCEDLFQAIERVKPKYNLFGHIHEAYGIYDTIYSDTIFINASVLNENYQLVNKPIIIDI